MDEHTLKNMVEAMEGDVTRCSVVGGVMKDSTILMVRIPTALPPMKTFTVLARIVDGLNLSLPVVGINVHVSGNDVSIIYPR